MEMEEIHTQVCKLPRVGGVNNSRNESKAKISGQIRRCGGDNKQYQDNEDEEDGEDKGGGGEDENNRLRAWHSSRIFRVSRASGGKDRHSKVLTAKGLRDRRVRLSVSTAIQFYDLQDRLGYDQPSKAVEWLIKAASDSIAELPSLDSKYPVTTNQLSDDEKLARTTSQAGFELENDPTYQQHISISKSACSSTSETSKGSVLSLSRSEIRVKARERARERAAKDKDKEQQNSQNSSFTELLTGGASNNHSPTPSTQQNHNSPSFFPKQPRHSPPTSMDYHFSTGLFGQTTPSSRNHHFSSGFSNQPHFGMPAPFNVTNEHHPELQQFSFLPDHHLIPEPEPVGGAGNDYNLNFSISSGFAGYNRGTLQSNSSSHLQQRFTSPTDGTNMPFFIGGNNAAASNASPTDQNQFPAGFDGRLHLYYGDGNRHSDMKGKEKR
ncbi:hypothetical protein IFM89_013236 [Coptis chinensis]|uniref:Uncharacterized protein n=1 Tax=Coptis chinensis TaxID=261450 RepID=A0A835IMR6_9MAGN|nr:hypothetical protein IFM89_013236 [Coptis chinensis]